MRTTTLEVGPVLRWVDATGSWEMISNRILGGEFALSNLGGKEGSPSSSVSRASVPYTEADDSMQSISHTIHLFRAVCNSISLWSHILAEFCMLQEENGAAMTEGGMDQSRSFWSAVGIFVSLISVSWLDTYLTLRVWMILMTAHVYLSLYGRGASAIWWADDQTSEQGVVTNSSI